MAEWLCWKRRTHLLTLQRTSKIKSKKLNKNVRKVRKYNENMGTAKEHTYQCCGGAAPTGWFWGARERWCASLAIGGATPE